MTAYEELAVENDRLTAALHKAKAHPDYTYLVVPVDSEFARLAVFDPQGWERNFESDIVECNDECWRRRIGGELSATPD